MSVVVGIEARSIDVTEFDRCTVSSSKCDSLVSDDLSGDPALDGLCLLGAAGVFGCLGDSDVGAESAGVLATLYNDSASILCDDWPEPSVLVKTTTTDGTEWGVARILEISADTGYRQVHRHVSTDTSGPTNLRRWSNRSGARAVHSRTAVTSRISEPTRTARSIRSPRASSVTTPQTSIRMAVDRLTSRLTTGRMAKI